MTFNRTQIALNRNRREAGLTLVEMMVALVITTVLLGGVTQIFISSKQSHKLTDSLGFMQESGRMAINLISHDLRRAGYFGGNADITTLYNGSLDPIAPASGTYNTCATATTNWALMLTQRVFGLNDSAGSYACIPSSGATKYLRGDILAARYSNAQSTTAAELAANAGALYLRTSLSSGRIFAGASASAAVNQIAGLAVTVNPLVADAYYIGTGSDTCNGDSIPSLYQVSLNSTGKPQVQEIVSGIEDLQVQYGLDTDAVADGIANQYLNASDIAAGNFSYWTWQGKPATNTIVSVRLWIVSRAACADATYTSDITYTYADKTSTPGDHYRRQVYSATVALRN